jgi:ribosomal protein S27E
MRGDEADITCNECGSVVRTVPVGDLQRTYDEIELSLDSVATEMCPHCGQVNVFPGWSSMMAFKCRGCGKVVRTNYSTFGSSICQT